MANAAYSRVEINDQLDVAPHTAALEGKRLLVELDTCVVELDHDLDEGTTVTYAGASLRRDEVERLRDACTDWLEGA